VIGKVLIVDDSETIRTLIKIHLIGHEVEFVEATDGQTGLVMATKHEPHVMVVDLKMPGMDGFTFLRTVRSMARFKATPVLLLTGVKGPSIEKEARLAGATHFIAKPFDGAELAERILECLPTSR
jgi:two-component system chemotaxis response regulator CheY